MIAWVDPLSNQNLSTVDRIITLISVNRQCHLSELVGEHHHGSDTHTLRRSYIIKSSE